MLNLILPKATEEQIAEENNYEYTSLPEAILRIQELEAMLEDIKQGDQDENSQIAELQAEIDRLKVFEKNQLEFEKRVEEFDKNVITKQPRY